MQHIEAKIDSLFDSRVLPLFNELAVRKTADLNSQKITQPSNAPVNAVQSTANQRTPPSNAIQSSDSALLNVVKQFMETQKEIQSKQYDLQREQYELQRDQMNTVANGFQKTSQSFAQCLAVNYGSNRPNNNGNRHSSSAEQSNRAPRGFDANLCRSHNNWGPNAYTCSGGDCRDYDQNKYPYLDRDRNVYCTPQEMMRRASRRQDNGRTERSNGYRRDDRQADSRSGERRSDYRRPDDNRRPNDNQRFSNDRNTYRTNAIDVHNDRSDSQDFALRPDHHYDTEPRDPPAGNSPNNNQDFS